MASHAWAMHGPLCTGPLDLEKPFSNFQLEIPVRYQGRGHKRKGFTTVGNSYQQYIFQADDLASKFKI